MTATTSLTDRYLAAAMRGIPERQRPDVERELRSSIADAIDDRVARGEDPGRAETAVLEDLGNPARFASEITGRPLHLIGPDLFIEYRRLLAMLLAIVVPLAGIILAAVALAQGDGYGGALVDGIGGAINVGVHLAFWVTLTFALVERASSATWARTELKEAIGPWSVERLPELPSAGRVGVGETIGEVLTLAITVGGLLLLRQISFFADGDGGPVTLLQPDVWTFWMPALIAVLVVIIGFEIVKFFVGRWTLPLAIVYLVLEATFAIPVIVLALTGSLVNPAFAEEIGWPPLADGNGPVMLVLAASVLLITGWEVFDGFRRARTT